MPDYRGQTWNSPHGTRSKYNEGCRCKRCTAANREYGREWMRQAHGYKEKRVTS